MKTQRFDIRLNTNTSNDSIYINIMIPSPYFNREEFRRKENERVEALAREIAEALDDLPALRFHISKAKRLPESVLREKMQEVLDKPDDEIYTSRGAYFNHLIKEYERKHRSRY